MRICIQGFASPYWGDDIEVSVTLAALRHSGLTSYRTSHFIHASLNYVNGWQEQLFPFFWRSWLRRIVRILVVFWIRRDIPTWLALFTPLTPGSLFIALSARSMSIVQLMLIGLVLWKWSKHLGKPIQQNGCIKSDESVGRLSASSYHRKMIGRRAHRYSWVMAVSKSTCSQRAQHREEHLVVHPCRVIMETKSRLVSPQQIPLIFETEDSLYKEDIEYKCFRIVCIFAFAD